MIQRLSVAQIREITATTVTDMSEHDRDEMAIPSYLHTNPLIRWLMWRRYAVIAQLAAFNRQMSVLEFGCGSGVFLPELSHSCGRVFATDLFPDYARAVSNQMDLDVNFVGDLSEIPGHSLDLIIAADVLEHITELAPYLNLFTQKLKPNGRLIISGPTENLVYRIGRFLAGFGDKGDYHHTNIDLLFQAISAQGYELKKLRKLPFPVAPALFKIGEFSVPNSTDSLAVTHHA